jgi:Carboxypeptidase regulatory-like domain
MSSGIGRAYKKWYVLVFLLAFVTPAFAAIDWAGVLREAGGSPVGGAVVRLTANKTQLEATTSSTGEFRFPFLPAGTYRVTVRAKGKEWSTAQPFVLQDGVTPNADLQLSASDASLKILAAIATAPAQGNGGTTLSSTEVSSLPLNSRDFSKLLLLAAGTMTDANGSANFTQQFTVNGQRGTASVFAVDGADTSDPEMGGATFSNFNVDAIQEVQSSSGVIPAEIGHGAAGFTNVVTKSGSNQIHGSAFEFVRNAAFDARNFFDHIDPLDPRRIPPFVRNEFGATNGGPVLLPGIYDGRDRTFYFAEYQGFRQVLGTTQVFAVPTADERLGIDTTTYKGDTLFVPVSPEIAPLLNRYPLPNDPQGAFGARTYATSSKVVTNTDQFSVRIDHKLTNSAELFGRFSLNQVDGPTTNPDQTAIDPSFGVKFFDHQRNAAVRLAQTVTPAWSFTTEFGYIRSTPFFPTTNAVDPAIAYGDGSFEGLNTADGSIFGSFGNLYQIRADATYLHGAHTIRIGGEVRLNKDATIFGMNPNGIYTFGGGTAYSPVQILSSSGQHNINIGDPLPDALTGLLTATPYSYTVTAAASGTPKGDKFDEAGVRREAYNFYVQDSWKFSPRWMLNYGLRYEVNSRIKEAKHRTSIGIPVAPGQPDPSFLTPGAGEIYLYNPQPAYPMDWSGLGPRVSVDFSATKHTVFHAGGAITTLLPNLWFDNYVTGGIPLVFQPLITATQQNAVPFHNTAMPLPVPEAYAINGQPLFPNGDSSAVAPNTQIDLQRFQNDLKNLTGQTQLLAASMIWRGFRNGYIGTYTLGVDHDFGRMKASAAYVGTAGIHLPSVFSPNGYNGADPGFAPFTQFDAVGHAIGGFGPEVIMSSGSHSSYNALQTSLSQNFSSYGLSFQASYTYSKSIDDASALLGAVSANAGVILQTLPQDPLDPHAEKAASVFDVTHAFSLSLMQDLPINNLGFLKPLGKQLTDGWQFLNITTLMTGPPFTVYSGIQQTGMGAGGTDRPDLLAMPDFSTSRTIREDYFGRGADNASFFSIPIGVPGGTGPNQGRFGTLGRNTFRGPGFHQLDLALIKNTSVGRRGAAEWGILQFRAEFFNIFNIVNFGLPSNTVLGSGFGTISHTAGSSRQIQFSLKLVY